MAPKITDFDYGDLMSDSLYLQNYNDTVIDSCRMDKQCITSFSCSPRGGSIKQDFALLPTDVVIGKGRKSNSHPGNVLLDRIVASNLEGYAAASNKNEKTDILSSIIALIRKNGGFVKEDQKSGKWFDVGDFSAREKIARLFRDALHGSYKSSRESKKKMRELSKCSKPLNSNTTSCPQLSLEPRIHKENTSGFYDSLPKSNIKTSDSGLVYSNLLECAPISGHVDFDWAFEPIPLSEVNNTGKDISFDDFMMGL